MGCRICGVNPSTMAWKRPAALPPTPQPNPLLSLARSLSLCPSLCNTWSSLSLAPSLSLSLSPSIYLYTYIHVSPSLPLFVSHPLFLSRSVSVCNTCCSSRTRLPIKTPFLYRNTSSQSLVSPLWRALSLHLCAKLGALSLSICISLPPSLSPRLCATPAARREPACR